MMDLLAAIDRWLFVFLNQTIANPVFDVIMPALTDWNKSVIGWSIFILLWLLLLWKGGRNGRIIGFLLIPMIVAGDQLNSQVFKDLVHRPRPCHTVDGQMVIPTVRLLVSCGSGYSFPSSHAFNNFSLAVYLTWFYRKQWWVWFTYAFLIGLSRVVVGVHFPGDVLGGAILGCCYALLYIAFCAGLRKLLPALRLVPGEYGAMS
jgi:membrane-associated phospholipid phosphatase